MKYLFNEKLEQNHNRSPLKAFVDNALCRVNDRYIIVKNNQFIINLND